MPVPTIRTRPAVVPPGIYAVERLFHNETIEVDGCASPTVGDEVALVAAVGDPVVFGLVRVHGCAPYVEQVAYTRHLFDVPLPAADLVPDGAGGLYRLADAAYVRLEAAALAAAPPRRDWLVSVNLPIEAGTPAAAVREFWTYVARLGPAELPAFVWPSGDERAMRAYVDGGPTSLDPEGD